MYLKARDGQKWYTTQYFGHVDDHKNITKKFEVGIV